MEEVCERYIEEMRIIDDCIKTKQKEIKLLEEEKQSIRTMIRPYCKHPYRLHPFLNLCGICLAPYRL
jgi:hypothetical protein